MAFIVDACKNKYPQCASLQAIDGERGQWGDEEEGDGKKRIVPLKRGGGWAEETCPSKKRWGMEEDEMEELEGGMGGVGYSKLPLGI